MKKIFLFITFTLLLGACSWSEETNDSVVPTPVTEQESPLDDEMDNGNVITEENPEEPNIEDKWEEPANEWVDEAPETEDAESSDEIETATNTQETNAAVEAEITSSEEVSWENNDEEIEEELLDVIDSIFDGIESDEK